MNKLKENVRNSLKPSFLFFHEGGNPLSRFNVGGVYSIASGVSALTIIDYWSRGPKATFIFHLKVVIITGPVLF